jgi:serine/threonine-protein kinase RsbW
MQATRTKSSDRLVLRSSLPELERLASWIEDIARNADLAADMAFALQLCLEEAVANIVMYGGAPDDAPIVVDIARADGSVTATIEDSALPFDPTKVPVRAKAASLDETRIGELGVHLMRHYSSEMHYERLEDRNRLTLRFDRSNAPAAWT